MIKIITIKVLESVCNIVLFLLFLCTYIVWEIEEMYGPLINIITGMKFNIIMVLLAILLGCLFDTKAEPLQLSFLKELNRRNFVFRQGVPVFGRTRLRPQLLKRCFKNNRLTDCPIVSQNRVLNRFVSRSFQNDAVINYLDQSNNASLRSINKPANRRIYDADHAHIEFDKLRRIKGDLAKKLILKPINLYLNKAEDVEIMAGIESTIETFTVNSEIIEASSQYAETTEMISQNTLTSSKKDDLNKNHDCLGNDNVSSLGEMVTDDIVNNTELHKKYLYGQHNEDLIFALNQFELKLYAINYNKFTTLTAESKGVNGMTFVQSGLFLALALMALSTEVDVDTQNEINQNFAYEVTDSEKILLLKQVISSLPSSSKELKFHWSSRLVLRSGRQVSEKFRSGAAGALQLNIEHFKGNETPEAMAMLLNKMIEMDSDGAIRDTFEEDDLSQNVEAVLISTLYFRAHWRSAPTLLNGTWVFRDSEHASRTVRMIRINDIMQYVDLPEWDAEAIKISYSTQGLSLLMLVPRGNSLKHLVGNVTNANLSSVTERMQCLRIAATLPLYTLRMTLLLPNKLQAMGISRLVDTSEAEDGLLRLSQAVQRIMFWAEAGRNAFKDDGYEWDEPPQMEMVIDRPYVFFVRWQNVNLMNGNFVL